MVMGTLNKLTKRKFKCLVEQLMPVMKLSIDTTQRLEGVVEIIHEKVLPILISMQGKRARNYILSIYRIL